MQRRNKNNAKLGGISSGRTLRQFGRILSQQLLCSPWFTPEWTPMYAPAQIFKVFTHFHLKPIFFISSSTNMVSNMFRVMLRWLSYTRSLVFMVPNYFRYKSSLPIWPVMVLCTYFALKVINTMIYQSYYLRELVVVQNQRLNSFQVLFLVFLEPFIRWKSILVIDSKILSRTYFPWQNMFMLIIQVHKCLWN